MDNNITDEEAIFEGFETLEEMDKYRIKYSAESLTYSPEQYVNGEPALDYGAAIEILYKLGRLINQLDV